MTTTFKPGPLATSDLLVRQFFSERLPVYRELMELQQEVRDSPEADAFFLKQRQDADRGADSVWAGFFRLMDRTGDQIDKFSSALTITKAISPAILDLCTAPGGLAQRALKCTPGAILRGLTLPESAGGLAVLIPHWETNPAIEVEFRDMTMLAGEMGVTDLDAIPDTHPDRANLSLDRPFLETKFDLVICDGKVSRAHPRPSYRENHEGTRLMMSQLVLAMQHARTGATIIVLLHRLDMWRTISIIHEFAKFAEVDLFKPTIGHTKRSSFYLIAKNVQPDSPGARGAVEMWKGYWKDVTLDIEDMEKRETGLDTVCDETVTEVLKGLEWLIPMAQPIFKIQVDNLRKVRLTNSDPEMVVEKRHGHVDPRWMQASWRRG